MSGAIIESSPAYPSPSPATEQSGSATTATGKGASAILTPLQPSHIAALEARGLDAELLVKLGVGASSRLSGDCIGIPYFDNGVRVATKYRTLTGEKRFTQDAGGRQILWNIDCLRDETLHGAAVLITEGEMDAFAAIQAGYPRTVSVPGGAPSQAVEGDSGKKYQFIEEAEPLLKDCREIIICSDGDGPGANLLHDLSLRLGRHRCKWVRYPQGCKDLNDALRLYGVKGVQATIQRAAWCKVEGVYRLSELPPIDPPKGHDIGIVSLWEHYRVRRGDFCVVTGLPGHGKALDIETPIPTPRGFVPLYAVQPGDEVFDESGRVCRVVNATSVMVGRPCYRVRFDDGSELVADAEHQWFTSTERSRRSARDAAKKRGGREEVMPRGKCQRHLRAWPSVVTTRQISETLIDKSGKRNHQVQLCGALAYAEKELPVDPWTLGVWLGDGTSSSGDITAAETEIREGIEAAGYETTTRSVPLTVGVLGLKVKLRTLEVLGNKHIPGDYLRASVPQRWALLRGLMDTDGTCMKDRTCEFTSMNERLAKGVLELALGLGLKATMNEGRATLRGRDCGLKYRVRFVSSEPIFTLPRKLSRQGVDIPPRIAGRIIVACDPVPSVPVKCIEVDAPSHLFLAGRECIPTHNSSFVNEVCCRMADKHGWNTVFASFEQNPQVDHRRALRSFKMQKREVTMSQEERKEADAWIDQHFAFIVPDEDDDTSLEWVLERTAAAIIRYEASIVVIDPWNEMDHARGPDMTLTEYVGFAIKQFKKLARKYQIHLIVVAHPAKMQRNREGKFPTPGLYDISDSAHWANKPDIGIVVHREDLTNSETTIRVVKSRYHHAIGRPGEVTGVWNEDVTRYTITEQTR